MLLQDLEKLGALEHGTTETLTIGIAKIFSSRTHEESLAAVTQLLGIFKWRLLKRLREIEP